MSTPVIRYPLDPTGVSPNNLVSGEIQTMPARAVRAITPDYGGFFTESLQITDQSTGLLLTSSQYYATELLEVPTGLYGMEICSIIMITDPSVSNTVSLTYQCLGGEYSTSTSAIVNLVNALELDDRPVTWPAILGKPSGFPPSAHLHSAGDLYGFEYIVQAIYALRDSILLGDTIAFDNVYQYLDAALANVEVSAASIIAALGYTPYSTQGGLISGNAEVAGTLKVDNAFRLYGWMDETLQSIIAETATTTIDVSLATVFDVTIAANTLFAFDVANVPGNINA
jgi:hypothetical protein